MIYLSDADVTLYHGDVLEALCALPAESVDCVVTSPPYWGLRDYGQEGQLGLEPTPEQYVERMVEVFREVRRVLADHGTVWCNLGDSYAGSNRGGAVSDESWKRLQGNSKLPVSSGGTRPVVPKLASGSLGAPTGTKPKDLVGIPWRVAFALQADGWYLRSDIIWAKPNPMPESVTDRPTKAHEYVFLLSKKPRYFFDQEAVREPAAYVGEQLGIVRGTKRRASANGRGQEASGNESPSRAYATDALTPAGRNIRSVWEISTQPYPEAHFATFPEELARRAIAAGCPEQVCKVCGKARERVVEVESSWRSRSENGAIRGNLAPEGLVGAGTQRAVHGVGVSHDLDSRRREVVGLTDCGHADYRPGIVLDPFIGSGTVCFVARKLGRNSIGIDLSAEYLALAARRLQQQSLFAIPAEG